MLQTTKEQGLDVLYRSVTLMNQTFVFGAFSVLLPLSIYITVKRGQKVRGNWLLFCAVAMFALSAACWSASLANLVFRVQAHFIHPSLELDKSTDSTFANAGITLNLVITDGVVVSRAWTLCREESPWAVYFPLVSLVSTFLSVVATIVLRVVISGVLRDRDTPPALTHAIDGAQITSVVLTLLTNAFATGLIAVKAWRHRKFMAQCFREAEVTGNKGKMVLAFLVESGAAYCVAGLALLAAATIRLPYGTLADLFFPAIAQLAGLYPIMILVIINTRMTMNETTLHGPQSFEMDIALPPLSPAASHHTHVTPAGESCNSSNAAGAAAAGQTVSGVSEFGTAAGCPHTGPQRSSTDGRTDSVGSF
ncbi:hypothetical protein AURDEDRAFT_88973 [Auricularia subglabra TFB-10046 SS5]|nr:hypothetical protein AURDEDRAFT_88973 [Auricularia subglabra TFB-10046 SS5]